MSAWLAIDRSGDIFIYKVRPHFDSKNAEWIGDSAEYVGNIDQLHASERVFEIEDLEIKS